MAPTAEISMDVDPKTVPADVLLGVEKGGPSDELRRAYLREARKWHPDKLPGDASEKERKYSQQRFVAIQRAWEKLQRIADSHFVSQRRAMQTQREDAYKEAKKELEEVESALADVQENIRVLKDAVGRGEWTGEDKQAFDRSVEQLFKAEHELMRTVEVCKIKVEDYERALIVTEAEQARRETEERQRKEEVEELDDKIWSLDGPRQRMSNVHEGLKECVVDFWAFLTRQKIQEPEDE